MSRNTSVATVSNRGSSNFVVHVLSTSTPSVDLAVNEIGDYSGTIPLRSPALVQGLSD